MSSYTGPVLIRREIWEVKSLTRTEKHLLSLISNLSKKNGCFASNYYLATQLQIKEKTIANLKCKLRKEKYLKKIKNSAGKNLHILHPDFEKELKNLLASKNPETGKKETLERKKTSRKKEHISKRKEKLKNSSTREDQISQKLQKEGFIEKEIQKLYAQYTKKEIQKGLEAYYLNIQSLKSQGKTWTKGLLFYKIREIKNMEIKKTREFNKKLRKQEENNQEMFILQKLDLPFSFKEDIRCLLNKGLKLCEIECYFKNEFQINNILIA